MKNDKGMFTFIFFLDISCIWDTIFLILNLNTVWKSITPIFPLIHRRRKNRHSWREIFLILFVVERTLLPCKRSSKLARLLINSWLLGSFVFSMSIPSTRVRNVHSVYFSCMIQRRLLFSLLLSLSFLVFFMPGYPYWISGSGDATKLASSMENLFLSFFLIRRWE